MATPSIDDQYKALIEQTLKALPVMGRNGATRKSVGKQLRFEIEGNNDIGYTVPLLKVKKIVPRIIVGELLWFISGSTDNYNLNKNNIYIWDANSSEEELDKRNLPWKKGDCGPIYGFQWRHWNSPYIGCSSEYTGKGIDQLSNVMRSLKSDPFSRNHLVIAYNPEQMKLMALPPCHYSYQFVCEPLAEGGIRINLIFVMRSTDIGLGLPFNIASYALLLLMVAKDLGYVPGEVIANLHDAHIYERHVEEGIADLLTVVVDPTTPRVKLNADRTLFEYKIEDFEFVDYNPGPVKKLTMLA